MEVAKAFLFQKKAVCFHFKKWTHDRNRCATLKILSLYFIFTMLFYILILVILNNNMKIQSEYQRMILFFDDLKKNKGGWNISKTILFIFVASFIYITFYAVYKWFYMFQIFFYSVIYFFTFISYFRLYLFAYFYTLSYHIFFIITLRFLYFLF